MRAAGRVHHVFLVPGFFGFANLGQIAYFGHVRRFLVSRLPELGMGARVHVVRPPPTASLAQRAACLAETIARTARGAGAEAHLVGHSSGGLDVRLLLSPGVSLPTRTRIAPVAARVRSAVTVTTPHRGTPLAGFFATLRGQRLLQLLSVGTIRLLHLGRLPLSVLLPVGGLLVRLDDLALDSRLLNELFGSLLEDFSVGRRRAVRRLLHAVAEDQSLLLQLTPEAMEVFDAAVTAPRDVRTGSVVAQAALPNLRGTLAAGLDPAAQVLHAVYRGLHRLTAAPSGGARRGQPASAALPPSHARALRRAYGALPGPEASDGIVPTRSQPWGRVLYCARGDHLDVLGHFSDTGRRRDAAGPPHVDWLSTGSGFDREQFDRLWSAVARFLVQGAA